MEKQKKKRKLHIHKWQQDDSCFNCGAYTEWCLTRLKNGDHCGKIRECVDGKCTITNY